MRPVWGSRSLFFARAVFGTLAALVLTIWAVAAPRVLSPGSEPPPTAPKTSASKPLEVPIRSFPNAQPSISNESSLSKHASGSYSSGAAGVQTRVIGQSTSVSAANSISNAKANSTPKRPPSVSSGGSKTPTNTTPTATPPTPTETTPATTPVTPPATRPVTPPTTPTESTPTHPPRHAPPAQTPTVPHNPRSHHRKDKNRGHDKNPAQKSPTQSPSRGTDRGKRPDRRDAGGSPCDRSPQDSHQGPGYPSGDGQGAEHHRDQRSPKGHR